MDRDGSTYSAPVVLARVRQPGLEAFLQGEMKRLNTDRSQAALQIVRDPWAISPSAGRPFLVYVNNDMLVASPDVAQLQRAAARIQQSSPSHFADTPLYQQVVRSYQQGAGWLFCADMEQIVAHNVPDGRNNRLPPGIGDVRYLMMERREVGGKTENRAATNRKRSNAVKNRGRKSRVTPMEQVKLKNHQSRSRNWSS